MRILATDADGAPIDFEMEKPDNGHTHLRDKMMLQKVAPFTAARFSSAVVMPNLEEPIITLERMALYRKDIQKVTGKKFDALMTLYFSDLLEPEEVEIAMTSDMCVGIKYYPVGLTTNSDKGVKNPADLWSPGTKAYACLQRLAAHGGVLFLHGADGVARKKVNVRGRTYEEGEELDPWDQEPHFVRYSLSEIRDAHRTLRISFEHLSTAEGAAYIDHNGGYFLGASITPHHLTLERADLFRGGFRPHRMWMPVIQPPSNRKRIQELVKEQRSYVWLGTDSAPHLRSKKEAFCCASGVTIDHAGVELYLPFFVEHGLLEYFERFAAHNFRLFTGRPRAQSETIRFVRESWRPRPFNCSFGDAIGDEVIPFSTDEDILWKLAS